MLANRRTNKREVACRKELAAGEHLLQFVGARVWTPSTNARSTPVTAAIDNGRRQALARQVVAESNLPLVPTRPMLLALTNRHLLFWEERGFQRRLHFLGKVPLKQIASVDGEKGDNARHFGVSVLLSLVIIAFIAGAEYLTGWVSFVLLLAVLSLAIKEEVHFEYHHNALLIQIDQRVIRLSTRMRDDPIGFAGSFKAAKRDLQ